MYVNRDIFLYKISYYAIIINKKTANKMKKVDLYITVTNFENSSIVRGEITFKSNFIIPYQAIFNRGFISKFILLNEEKLILNSHLPENMKKEIYEGIHKSLRNYLSNKNNPLKETIPAAEEGTFTQKLYQGAEKIIGTKMMTFEMGKNEFENLFEVLPENKEQEKLVAALN